MAKSPGPRTTEGEKRLRKMEREVQNGYPLTFRDQYWAVTELRKALAKAGGNLEGIPQRQQRVGERLGA